jgi:hypothetical protein
LLVSMLHHCSFSFFHFLSLISSAFCARLWCDVGEESCNLRTNSSFRILIFNCSLLIETTSLKYYIHWA